MKEITIKLYSFDELSDEAKERAHSHWLEHGYWNPWESENRETIEKFQKALGITLDRWEYGSSCANYGVIEWGVDWTTDILSLKGNRACSYLWNRFGHLLLQRRRHYYMRDKADGKFHECVGLGAKKYVSKVFFDRVYDGTCPLTGYCLDCDALDPMAYFCFGVKWNGELERRVMIPHDERRAWASTSVEEVVRECCHSLFRQLQKDCEYNESIENFAAECEENDWMFEENGTKRSAA